MNNAIVISFTYLQTTEGWYMFLACIFFNYSLQFEVLSQNGDMMCQQCHEHVTISQYNCNVEFRNLFGTYMQQESVILQPII